MDSNLALCMKTSFFTSEQDENYIQELRDKIRVLQKKNVELSDAKFKKTQELLHENWMLKVKHTTEINDLTNKHRNEKYELKDEIYKLRNQNRILSSQVNIHNYIPPVSLESPVPIAVAEALPVWEIEPSNKKAIADLRNENFILKAELESLRKEHDTCLNTIAENKRLFEENEKVRRELGRKIYAERQLCATIEAISQDKERAENIVKTLEYQKTTLELKEQTYETELQQLRKNLNSLTSTVKKTENKSTQTFSESDIAEALLKSQPKRLRYLK